MTENQLAIKLVFTALPLNCPNVPKMSQNDFAIKKDLESGPQQGNYVAAPNVFFPISLSSKLK